jgi:hypothetical protein
MRTHDELSSALEALVDDFTHEPDTWNAILRQANPSTEAPAVAGVSAPRRVLSRRLIHGRGAMRLVAAAAIVATSMFAAISFVPTGGGHGDRVLARAAAAIPGSGPVAHVTATFPDLAGRPLTTTYQVWYDTTSERAYMKRSTTPASEVDESWIGPEGWYTSTDGGPVTKFDDLTDVGRTSEIGSVAKLFGTYEEQLRNGNATLAGEETFKGTPVYAIDVPYDTSESPVTGEKSNVSVRILVDRESYRPVAAALLGDGHLLPWVNPTTDEPILRWFVISSAGLEPASEAFVILERPAR